MFHNITHMYNNYVCYIIKIIYYFEKLLIYKLGIINALAPPPGLFYSYLFSFCYYLSHFIHR